MKYKVGDKVKIKSLDWYNTFKNIDGDVYIDVTFVSPMSKYCGKISTITKINKRGNYNLYIDNGKFDWTDDMFDENFKDMEKEIIIPDGWEVEKVEGNKVILKESKKELPKTWEECYKLYAGRNKREYISNFSDICSIDEVKDDVSNSSRNCIPAGLGKPLLALCQLLVCRDVYRNGWKPDWNDGSIKSIIEYNDRRICKSHTAVVSRILSFQSDEVRDKFLENFKDLIEEAKELI